MEPTVAADRRRSVGAAGSGADEARGRRWWSPPPLLGPDEGVFSQRSRQLAIAWVLGTLPLVAVLGAVVRGERAYLISWVLVGGLYATPALWCTWVAGGRAPARDRRFWRFWWLGLVLVYCNGLAILLVELLGLQVLQHVSAAAVLAATVVFAVPLVDMMRSRSGARTLALDVNEGALVLVSIISPITLFVGEQILEAPAAWFTVPAAITTIGLVCASCWSVILFVRLNGEHRVVEALGVALAMVGALNAGAQVAQGIAGFDLHATPLLLLQAMCLGLVLVTPLHLPRTPAIGLDRLPPQDQVRKGGWQVATPLLTLPLLWLGVRVVGDEASWARPYAISQVVVLLVLATTRQMLAALETRRLYSAVERAAIERHQLLADVIAAADHDRHRVAAQLHEQATSTYVALTSYARATGAVESDAGPLRALRDELEVRAEALRRLMVAVRPLEVADQRPSSLAASITAYLHSLYGDAAQPHLDLRIDGDLELDWTTETIAMRILQEALRNVSQHAEASHLWITIGFLEDAVEVTVRDDGRGFDPSASMFESGIETMRSFAAFADGSVHVGSAPDAGTTVRARLGAGDLVLEDGEAVVIDLRDRSTERAGRRTAQSVAPR